MGACWKVLGSLTLEGIEITQKGLQMTLSDKRQHFTLMLSELLWWARANDLHVALDYVKRSEQEQAAMVEAGASQTMNSKHLDGLAMDLLLYASGVYVTSAEPYRPLGDYWKSLDPANVWGGDWETLVDAGHFEYAG